METPWAKYFHQNIVHIPSVFQSAKESAASLFPALDPELILNIKHGNAQFLRLKGGITPVIGKMINLVKKFLIPDPPQYFLSLHFGFTSFLLSPIYISYLCACLYSRKKEKMVRYSPGFFITISRHPLFYPVLRPSVAQKYS